MPLLSNLTFYQSRTILSLPLVLFHTIKCFSGKKACEAFTKALSKSNPSPSSPPKNVSQLSNPILQDTASQPRSTALVPYTPRNNLPAVIQNKHPRGMSSRDIQEYHRLQISPEIRYSHPNRNDTTVTTRSPENELKHSLQNDVNTTNIFDMISQSDTTTSTVPTRNESFVLTGSQLKNIIMNTERNKILFPNDVPDISDKDAEKIQIVIRASNRNESPKEFIKRLFSDDDNKLDIKSSLVEDDSFYDAFRTFCALLRTMNLKQIDSTEINSNFDVKDKSKMDFATLQEKFERERQSTLDQLDAIIMKHGINDEAIDIWTLFVKERNETFAFSEQELKHHQIFKQYLKHKISYTSREAKNPWEYIEKKITINPDTLKNLEKVCHTLDDIMEKITSLRNAIDYTQREDITRDNLKYLAVRSGEALFDQKGNLKFTPTGYSSLEKTKEFNELITNKKLMIADIIPSLDGKRFFVCSPDTTKKLNPGEEYKILYMPEHSHSTIVIVIREELYRSFILTSNQNPENERLSSIRENKIEEKDRNKPQMLGVLPHFVRENNDIITIDLVLTAILNSNNLEGKYIPSLIKKSLEKNIEPNDFVDVREPIEISTELLRHIVLDSFKQKLTFFENEKTDFEHRLNSLTEEKRYKMLEKLNNEKKQYQLAKQENQDRESLPEIDKKLYIASEIFDTKSTKIAENVASRNEKEFKDKKNKEYAKMKAEQEKQDQKDKDEGKKELTAKEKKEKYLKNKTVENERYEG